MKEITIKYNTYDEYSKSNRRPHINVLIDGKPIERLKSFSIEFDVDELEPVYTIKQYMDYPIEDIYTK